MNINWKIRIQSLDFWTGFIPAILLLIQAVAAIFGFTIDLGDFGNRLLYAVNALFGVLTLIGVVKDPTTKGFGDSDRAMSYTERV